MSDHREHSPASIVRHADVAVIGGSAAGLAAALQLCRQHRSVIVVDDGRPRNAPAAHMHGVLGWDGAAPADFIGRGRDEVRRYGGEVLTGRVTHVESRERAVRVHLTGGHAIEARRVILASGLVDNLPEIDGLRERWGLDVVHCPFCHGYEVRGQRIVQLVTAAAAAHAIPLWHHLAGHLTVVVDPDIAPQLDAAAMTELRSAGVDVVEARASRIVAPAERLTAVELADGTLLDADAVACGPTVAARTETTDGLGVEVHAHPSGLGTCVVADETGRTSVAGIYAAGNVRDPGQQVAHAAADGARVGAAVAFDLATDTAHASQSTAHQRDWDGRYAGRQVWSGNPNGALVAELTERPLGGGRALDVGAGEGADAIWLAEHGWKVTANEISHAALRRLADEAARRGLTIDDRPGDANATLAFERDAYDLVIAMYASIPRTADNRGVTNLLDAVAPGGTLLVVSHDLAPMRSPIDPAAQSRPFDPDAYVRVDDVVREIAGRPDWRVDIDETRARPAGAASHHHVDDLVLRAVRRS